MKKKSTLQSFLLASPRALSLALSLALVACSGGGGGGSSTASHTITCSAGSVTNYGIIGGQGLNKDTALARGIVFIYKVNSDNSGFACTATLIDRNLILTAAHCVQGADASNLRAYFTNQPACDAVARNLYPNMRSVDRIEIHSEYSGIENGKLSISTSQADKPHADIALVRLSTEAPEDFYPLELSSEAIPIDDYSRLVVAGYGKTDPRQGYKEDDLFLRVVTLSTLSEIHRLELSQVTSTPAQDYVPSSSREFIYLDQTQDRGMCMGDSGGPAMMHNSQGNLVQVGIASHVLSTKDDGRLCAYASAETNVYYYKTWLETKFQTLRNSYSQKSTLFK